VGRAAARGRRLLGVGGLIGRDVTLARARTGQDIRVIGDLVGLAGTFERLMVRPGSFAVLAAGLLAAWARHIPLTTGWLLASIVLYVSIVSLVPLVFLPRGRVFERALGDATERGEMTAELSAAFRDRAVAWARGYEAMVVTVVVVLMVTKPS
jgi:uncharacterized membrane protein